MTSGEAITIRPFIEPADGGGYIAGFMDEHDQIFGAVVPIAPEMVEVAVLSDLTLEPHIDHDDGTVGIASTTLDDETYMALLKKRTVLGKRPIDEMVIDGLRMADNDPEALNDLQVFRERLRRALDAVEAKIAERTRK